MRYDWGDEEFSLLNPQPLLSHPVQSYAQQYPSHPDVIEAFDMATKRPATIAEYIRAAPREGQPHLRKLHAILKSVAPQAEQVIKWGSPFFVEPRFLFAFSACKAHCNFAPSPEALEAFRQELKQHQTTKNYLQIPYDQPVPEDLVRRIAEYRLREVTERADDGFW